MIRQTIKEEANGEKSIAIEITDEIKNKILGEVAKLLINNISTRVIPVIAQEVVKAISALEQAVEERAKEEGLS